MGFNILVSVRIFFQINIQNNCQIEYVVSVRKKPNNYSMYLNQMGMITQTTSTVKSLFGVDVELSETFGLSIFQLCPQFILYFVNNSKTIGQKIKELKGMNLVNFDFNMELYFNLNYIAISESIIKKIPPP